MGKENEDQTMSLIVRIEQFLKVGRQRTERCISSKDIIAADVARDRVKLKVSEEHFKEILLRILTQRKWIIKETIKGEDGASVIYIIKPEFDKSITALIDYLAPFVTETVTSRGDSDYPYKYFLDHHRNHYCTIMQPKESLTMRDYGVDALYIRLTQLRFDWLDLAPKVQAEFEEACVAFLAELKEKAPRHVVNEPMPAASSYCSMM